MEYVTAVKKKEKDKKMNLKVEAVSNKFGPSFKANGIWHNPDKVAMPDLSPIRSGDEIEAEVNGKWVKSFTIISRGNAVAPTPRTGPAASAPKSAYVSEVPAGKQGAGQAAVLAAFGPAFAYYLANGDEAEAFQKALDVVERVEDFLNNGRSK